MDGLLIGAGKTVPKPLQKPTISVQAQQTKVRKATTAPIRTDDEFLAGLIGQMGVDASKPGEVKQFRAQPSRRARTVGIKRYEGEAKKVGTKKEIQMRSAAAIHKMDLKAAGVEIHLTKEQTIQAARVIKADYENIQADIVATEKRLRELKGKRTDKSNAYNGYITELGPDERPPDLPEKLDATAVPQGMEMTGGKKQRRTRK